MNLMPLDEGTVIVGVVFMALIFIAGGLLGSALTSWWHERRGPARAWRYQIARELHGEAVFEEDSSRSAVVRVQRAMEPTIRGGVAMDNDETRWGGISP